MHRIGARGSRESGPAQHGVAEPVSRTSITVASRGPAHPPETAAGRIAPDYCRMSHEAALPIQ